MKQIIIGLIPILSGLLAYCADHKPTNPEVIVKDQHPLVTNVSVPMDFESGAEAYLSDYGVHVSVPKESIIQDTTLSLSWSDAIPSNLPEGRVALSGTIDIQPSMIFPMDKPAKITIDLTKYPISESVDLETIQLSYWNDQSLTYEPIFSLYDPDKMQLVGFTTHFSFYIIDAGTHKDNSLPKFNESFILLPGKYYGLNTYYAMVKVYDHNDHNANDKTYDDNHGFVSVELANEQDNNGVNYKIQHLYDDDAPHLFDFEDPSLLLYNRSLYNDYYIVTIWKNKTESPIQKNADSVSFTIQVVDNFRNLVTPFTQYFKIGPTDEEEWMNITSHRVEPVFFKNPVGPIELTVGFTQKFKDIKVVEDAARLYDYKLVQGAFEDDYGFYKPCIACDEHNLTLDEITSCFCVTEDIKPEYTNVTSVSDCNDDEECIIDFLNRKENSLESTDDYSVYKARLEKWFNPETGVFTARRLGEYQLFTYYYDPAKNQLIRTDVYPISVTKTGEIDRIELVDPYVGDKSGQADLLTDATDPTKGDSVTLNVLDGCPLFTFDAIGFDSFDNRIQIFPEWSMHVVDSTKDSCFDRFETLGEDAGTLFFNTKALDTTCNTVDAIFCIGLGEHDQCVEAEFKKFKPALWEIDTNYYESPDVGITDTIHNTNSRTIDPTIVNQRVSINSMVLKQYGRSDAVYTITFAVDMVQDGKDIFTKDDYDPFIFHESNPFVNSPEEGKIKMNPLLGSIVTIDIFTLYSEHPIVGTNDKAYDDYMLLKMHTSVEHSGFISKASESIFFFKI